jgi:hypothetical protein
MLSRRVSQVASEALSAYHAPTDRLGLVGLRSGGCTAPTYSRVLHYNSDEMMRRISSGGR